MNTLNEVELGVYTAQILKEAENLSDADIFKKAEAQLGEAQKYLNLLKNQTLEQYRREMYLGWVCQHTQIANIWFSMGGRK